MAFDGIAVCAAARELDDRLRMGKIEKIYQPEKDELVFHIHTPAANYRLYASSDSSHPGLYIIDKNLPNPLSPGNFCMLLRKHIQGGRIAALYQKDSERMIEMDLETSDELGFSVNRKLIFEIMGKHSNIILTDPSENRIIDSIKRVPPEVNRIRQILPGHYYEYPPVQNKIPFRTVTFEQIVSMTDADEGEKASSLLKGIQGISPVIAEELAAAGDPAGIFQRLSAIRNTAASKDPAPKVYLKENGEPADFHVVPISIYGDLENLSFDTVSEAISCYYSRRISSNRIKQKSSDLHRKVSAALKKMYLKQQRLSEDLLNAENSEKYRLYGEILTANIHNVSPGASSAVLTNYYDGKDITVPLDRRFPAAKNAQMYFKKFSKAKTAVKEKQKQLQENEKEISYLESVMTYIENAEDISQLEDIRDELTETGFLRKKKKTGSSRKKKEEFYSYTTSDGFRVLAGRNNRENDLLTFRTAGRNDIWFHTKDIPGSHVILLSEGRKVSDEAIREAASISAWHSRGRSSENVPVDWTLVRHVKKPAGARPGMCIFTDNRTIYAAPKLP